MDILNHDIWKDQWKVGDCDIFFTKVLGYSGDPILQPGGHSLFTVILRTKEGLNSLSQGQQASGVRHVSLGPDDPRTRTRVRADTG
jgi:hypothetical protein